MNAIFYGQLWVKLLPIENERVRSIFLEKSHMLENYIHDALDFMMLLNI